MKKYLAMILAAMMALSLVACGGGDDTAPAESTPPASSAASSAAEPAAEPEAEPAEEELTYAEVQIGDLVVTLPEGYFGEVMELEKGYAVRTEDNQCIITVVGPAPADMTPEDLTEEAAGAMFAESFNQSYTNTEYTGYATAATDSGLTFVDVAFRGDNANGEREIVHSTYVFSEDQTMMYAVTSLCKVDDPVFNNDFISAVIYSVRMA